NLFDVAWVTLLKAALKEKPRPVLRVYMLPLRGSKLQPNNRNRLRWVEGLRNFNTSKIFVSQPGLSLYCTQPKTAIFIRCYMRQEFQLQT
ncbi:MAG: hypothetical protein QNJ47_04985, partial [Nostocaceae cyanobacterium]|nr:hypothetical protein [Nostocaceae cyanobacterium]